MTTVLALGIAGQLTRLSSFIAAFVATTLVIIAISAVCPAAGPWLFLDIQPATANGFLPPSSTSWPVFLGLRDGTLHTVYGIAIRRHHHVSKSACGARRFVPRWRSGTVKSVRWFALGLNILLVIATPAYGSHYVVDVIAGILIAAYAGSPSRGCFDTASKMHPEHCRRAINDPPSIVPDSAGAAGDWRRPIARF